ncbi:MAG: hypothetical protein R3315_03160 [Woeseiaceae bacterium]|nr:hypothetical protein [Woeseiaceae bacterium]
MAIALGSRLAAFPALDSLRYAAGILLIAVAAVAAAAETTFGGWRFDTPENLVVTERRNDRLTLALSPATGASRATIVLFAPQPVPPDLDAWLTQRWQTLLAGREVLMEDPPGEAVLIDMTIGVRRSAVTAGGEGLVQLDAFVRDGKLHVATYDTVGETGMAAYLTLFLGMTLGESGPVVASEEAAAPAAREGPVAADTARPAPPEPGPPGPDPTASLAFAAFDGMRTSADLNTVRLDRDVRNFVRGNSALLGTVPPQPMSFTAAIESVGRAVGVTGNAAHLDELARHPELQTPEQLAANAAAELVQGNPALALANLWVAHRRWPDDGNILFDMAGLLASVGLVNQSQAIVSELIRRKAKPVMPVGIDPAAAIDYLRAFNSMRTGDYATAARLLRPVVEEEPALAEAALALALVEHAQDGEPAGPYIRGFYRRALELPAVKGDVVTGGAAPGSGGPDVAVEVVQLDEDEVGLPAIRFIDLSRGRPGNLPDTPIPSNPHDAIEYYNAFPDLSHSFSSSVEAANDRRQKLDDAWRQTVPPGPLLERYEEILRIRSVANAPVAELRMLIRQQEQAGADLAAADAYHAERFMVEFETIMRRYRDSDETKACPDIRNLVERTQADLRKHVVAVDAATRRVHRLWHQYATALGQMVGNPGLRTYLAADIALANEVEYYGLLQNALGATIYSPHYEYCLAVEAAALELEALVQVEVAQCDQQNKESRSYKLFGFKLEQSCEGPVFGFEQEFGGVNVKAEARFDQDGWIKEHAFGAGARGVSGEVTVDKEGNFSEAKVGAEVQDAFGVAPVNKAELTYNRNGDTTIYLGKKSSLELDVSKANLPLPSTKVSMSTEEGSGFVVRNGRVVSAFTKRSTENAFEVGGVGGGTRSEVTRIVPGPRVYGGSPPLPEFRPR